MANNSEVKYLSMPSSDLRTALLKRKPVLIIAAGFALLGALIPIAVAADDPTATQAAGVAADTVWVIVTGCLVMFMQAGFAMLEVGFSRMKNVGTVVAKVVTNLSVSSIAYWAVGFGLAFGAGGWFAFIGGSAFFPTFSPGSQLHLPAIDASTATASAKWFFEFVFCAVSLAIVWGTMIERTKFIVYILFGIPFAAFIYPLISHQLFGGGFLQATLGAQDFAGSTVVQLTGATAVLAGSLRLGPRIAKYEKGRSNAIPGHNMPLAQLGVLILWFGWFGFNPGSTLNATHLHFADVVGVTHPCRRRRRGGGTGHGLLHHQDDGRRHDRQRSHCGAGRHHRTLRLRRAMGRDRHRRGCRSDRGGRSPGARQVPRRPGGRAAGSRARRHLGRPH